MLFSRRGLGALILRSTVALAAMLALGQAAAQGAKPVRLLVGFPPGGGTDAVARILAERLTAMGLSVGFMPQQQLAQRERAYTRTWARIIKSSGFQPQ